jgi:hypothetical protein
MLHYHREYSHIDSLKLGIIMQLNVHGFIHSDLKVEDGETTTFGQRIASASQIPLFAQNEEYLELVKQYKEADTECAVLLSEYGLDTITICGGVTPKPRNTSFPRSIFMRVLQRMMTVLL